jgi:hypothetical protein
MIWKKISFQIMKMLVRKNSKWFKLKNRSSESNIPKTLKIFSDPKVEKK